MPCLGVVLLEARRGEEDEAGQTGGFAFHGARDSIYEQRCPSKAVPHGPQPVGLLLCALLMTCVTTSTTTALAVMLSAHPALMSAIEVCVKSHAYVFGLRRRPDSQRPNVFA